MLNLITYYVEPNNIVIGLAAFTNTSTELWFILPTY